MTVKISRQAGLTITELLISLVLGVFLVSGVLSVFLGCLQTFRTNDALARVQESGRFAMEIMRRDLREAGYFGCRQSLEPEIPRSDAALTPGFIRNTLNPAPSGGTDPLQWEYNLEVGLEGFAATTAGGGSGWSPSIPTNTLISGALDHSDIIATSSAKGAGITVTAHPGGNPPGSADIQLDTNNGLEQFDVIMVTDCTSGAIMQVTSANPDQSGSVAHNTGVGTPGNYTKALGRSFTGADLFSINKSVWYIAASPTTGRPGLFRNNEEVVENVERLRVFFGVDSNEDRRIDSYVRAGTAPLEGPAATDTDWESVVAVRFHLLISSGEEDGITEAPLAVPFAGGTFNAPDNRIYQEFTATVAIRNRLP
jgi:type IV pilus assembly protein PilW